MRLPYVYNAVFDGKNFTLVNCKRSPFSVSCSQLMERKRERERLRNRVHIIRYIYNILYHKTVVYSKNPKKPVLKWKIFLMAKLDQFGALQFSMIFVQLHHGYHRISDSSCSTKRKIKKKIHATKTISLVCMLYLSLCKGEWAENYIYTRNGQVRGV